ncbi:hypothetical protein RR46_12219 [Papilio xuthus]|uniref:Uncharacterized protein n=1 Tax=Papilio xuthus TaxID=66420 RepID=A0A194PVR1_PAPXU|nr:hypothetical protein RR46_12219 [Papilio xuthus]
MALFDAKHLNLFLRHLKRDLDRPISYQEPYRHQHKHGAPRRQGARPPPPRLESADISNAVFISNVAHIRFLSIIRQRAGRVRAAACSRLQAAASGRTSLGAMAVLAHAYIWLSMIEHNLLQLS